MEVGLVVIAFVRHCCNTTRCLTGELFYGEPAKLVKAKEAAARLCARGGRTLNKLPHILHILPVDQASAAQGSGHTDKSSSDSSGKDEGTSCVTEEGGGLTRRAEESEEEFLIRNCR